MPRKSVTAKGDKKPMPYPCKEMTYVVCTRDEMLRALRSELGELYHSEGSARSMRRRLNQVSRPDGVMPFVIYGLVRIEPKGAYAKK